jgi:type III restriction enzyme
MNKEQALNYIKTSMDLRKPQYESLRIFSEYLDSEEWKVLLGTLQKSSRKPTSDLETSARVFFHWISTTSFTGFDGRSFPAFTFALATGVGKTRLMGAFVAYLFLVYGIQHFLLVAPGNTIYTKLVDDFSRMNNPKYVFRGIEEINGFSANVITKDNYNNNPNNTNATLFGNKLQINIFNIQQFAQREVEQEKGITKGWETNGKSYFEYLANLDDLVVMLDESHHYHADAAFESLDRMGPLIGLEFTATPYNGETTGRGRNRVLEKKHNIVYDYNLWNAIRDGYVKDPWIGTEADVNFREFETDSIETDIRKLQLAAYFHERAKVAIAEYANDNNVRAVKPVMLIVASDTTHAKELKAKIDSDDFRGGAYRGKVIEVHTKTTWVEADEAVDKLIKLEDEDNYVEVVIHVNMLKEGWDVANIYTIVPLRQSASDILTEQTLGRGLRLPYGRRVSYPDHSTGKKKYELVDRVMIVAHEKYSQVVEQAKNSTLIQPTNIEQVDQGEVWQRKVVVESKPLVLEKIETSIRENTIVMEEITKIAEKELSNSFDAETPLEVQQYAVEQRVSEHVADIAESHTAKFSFESYHEQESKKENVPLIFEEGSLFAGFSDEAKNALQAIQQNAQKTLEEHNIPIPRLILTPHAENITIEKFTLDISKLSRYATETTILEQALQWTGQINLFGNVVGEEWERRTTQVSSFGSRDQSPENTIIATLVSEPLVSYEEQSDLLIALASEATAYYRTFAKDDNNLALIVETNRTQIAKEIYKQMTDHKKILDDGYRDSGLRSPHPYLESHNSSKVVGVLDVTLASQVNSFHASLTYTGFSKACHARYKFDSSDEVRLAYLLDNETLVEDWLRPAPKQFEGLYWRDATGDTNNRYEPDFVVEFANEVVMIEVKPEEEISNADVQAKKATAEHFCKVVSEHVGQYGIVKPWRYVIIPTNKITLTSTIANILWIA